MGTFLNLNDCFCPYNIVFFSKNIISQTSSSPIPFAAAASQRATIDTLREQALFSPQSKSISLSLLSKETAVFSSKWWISPCSAKKKMLTRKMGSLQPANQNELSLRDLGLRYFTPREVN